MQKIYVADHRSVVVFAIHRLPQSKYPESFFAEQAPGPKDRGLDQCDSIPSRFEARPGREGEITVDGWAGRATTFLEGRA